MIIDDDESKNIREFIDYVRKNKPIIRSTSAKKIEPGESGYPANLYNVEGSTDDPKPGKETSWTQLLTQNGIGTGTNDKCYVELPLPPVGEKTSHPIYSKGGHMTTNANGKVDDGGTCYLMPLCAWHNSKGRDRVKFTYFKLTILQLFGYMKKDTLLTFLMRMPAAERNILLYHNDSGWQFKNFDSIEDVNDITAAPQTIEHFIFNRSADGQTLTLIN